MNTSHIAETVSAIDAATTYLINAPYTTNTDYAARREVLMKLGESKGALSYALQKITVEVVSA